jgi:hypothetical protein
MQTLRGRVARLARRLLPVLLIESLSRVLYIFFSAARARLSAILYLTRAPDTRIHAKSCCIVGMAARPSI